MSGISGVNSYSFSNYSRYTNEAVKKNHQKLASGKKVNSAADNAAALAMIEKQRRAVNGHEAGNGNVTMAKSALNVSDGAMSGITDYLQGIRELAVRSLNTASVSADEREDIQQQIDQYKQGIDEIAKSTEFNTQKLMDGSNKSFELATDGNGSMTSISGSNATLKALGIEDFDVTGDFDLKAIDKAIDQVNKSRSKAGAQYNGLESTYHYNNNVSYNTTASISRMQDTDMGKAVSALKKNQLLQTYNFQMQSRMLAQHRNQFADIFA